MKFGVMCTVGECGGFESKLCDAVKVFYLPTDAQ
jgi:hypothetical protein